VTRREPRRRGKSKLGENGRRVEPPISPSHCEPRQHSERPGGPTTAVANGSAGCCRKVDCRLLKVAGPVVQGLETRIRHGASLTAHGCGSTRRAQTERAAWFDLLHLPDVNGHSHLRRPAASVQRDRRAVFGTWNGVVRGVNEFFVMVPKKEQQDEQRRGIMVTRCSRRSDRAPSSCLSPLRSRSPSWR